MKFIQKDLFKNFNKKQLLEMRKNIYGLDFVIGYCGVGKTTILNVFYKNYDIITIYDFKEECNILDMITTNNSINNNKKIIVVIDNIETITDLEMIMDIIKSKNFNKYVKIIITILIKTKNDSIVKYINEKYYNILYIDKINDKELEDYLNKNGIHENTREIINKIDSNLYKLESILKFSKTEIEQFIKDNEIKKSLTTEEVVEMIFNKTNLTNIQEYIIADPQNITNNIYYNIHGLKEIDDISNVLECITNNDGICHKMYANNYWDLYQTFAYNSPIQSMYLIKDKPCIKKKMEKWTDISYNYMKSKNDMLVIINNNKPSQINILQDLETTSQIIKLIRFYIEEITIYIKNSKKNKNTSAQEKLELYKKVEKNERLQKIIMIIKEYGLYTMKNNKFELLISRIQNLVEIKKQKPIINLNNEFLLVQGLIHNNKQKNESIYNLPNEELWFN